ncbi:MAG TPA: uroporphyrinogen decarboxylase [Candidatus Subteraquimicrobiales bacterium]
MSRADRFLKACRRQPVDSTPVWIMRQAGRYMQEYRNIREKIPFLKMCKTPELAAEVTLLPVKKIKVDAAILFSDILIPLEAMGTPLEFSEGPKLGKVRDRSAVDALKIPDPEKDTGFVMEAIRILRRELGGKVPLIGFAGAPFTLATYAIEGGSSQQFLASKKMMFSEPQMVHQLLDKLARTVTLYLNAQIEAGAQALQLFDTWAGILSPRDYDEFALPYAKQIFDGLNRDGIPLIYYINGGSSLLERMKTAGSDVIGVDWRIELGVARKRLGPEVAVQGNLDPFALFLPPEKIEERVQDILEQAGDTPGYIFNLGHGVLPQTPVENVIAMVEAVHKHGKKRDRG